MKKGNSIYLMIAISVFSMIFVFNQACEASNPAVVEILFMNHGPMRPTIKNIQSILQSIPPGKINARWYDYDQPTGKSFMKQKGIQGHIPLLIFINGSPKFNGPKGPVTFMGFPSGAGPYQFQGKWTLNDLKRALQSVSR